MAALVRTPKLAVLHSPAVAAPVFSPLPLGSIRLKGWPFERGPYYMDGLIPLAFLLDDARLQAKIKPSMQWSLQSQPVTLQLNTAVIADWHTESGVTGELLVNPVAQSKMQSSTLVPYATIKLRITAFPKVVAHA